MGTRSLTHVLSQGETLDRDKGNVLLTMYRQMDGYPRGHGEDLAGFLKGIRLVNGISMSNKGSHIANGMGCLAAQVVAYFKAGPEAFPFNHFVKLAEVIVGLRKGKPMEYKPTAKERDGIVKEVLAIPESYLSAAIYHGPGSTGGIYIKDPGASDCDEEYVYTVYQIGDFDALNRGKAKIGLRCETARWTESRTGKEHPSQVLFEGEVGKWRLKAVEKAKEEMEK